MEDLNVSFVTPEEQKLLHLQPRVQPYAPARATYHSQQDKLHYRRGYSPVTGSDLAGDFDFNTHHTAMFSERAALYEANRCLKCADAPCQSACSSAVPVKEFISAMTSRNYYGAAKQIFSANPCGLTCGLVCPVSDLCEGACNLAATEEGAIKIGRLQAFATDVFKKMNLRQIRDPSATPVEQLPPSYRTKIALVGLGPASVSCATFLGRLGYTDVTVFEKHEKGVAAGLSSLEIPQFRLPYDAVKFECDLMTDLGVKVEYGKALGKDFTVQSLKKEQGFECVFVGIGLPSPKRHPIFDGLTPEHGFYTSKDFLPLVSKASKKGMCACAHALPELHGRVVVLGAGDTAMDCATSALRCGAKKVFIAFRRGMLDVRAVPEEAEVAKEERCEWLPFSLPKAVVKRNGRVAAIELYKMDVDEETGEYRKDEDQFTRLKCDFIISAFGSQVGEELHAACAPVKFRKDGYADLDRDTMQAVGTEWLFGGGDFGGNGTTVEASNDGKIASWHMHRYVQRTHGITVESAEPQLPKFFTPVDRVDLSLEVAGIKFENPFGLASATPCTTSSMIRRAFEQGWGFAVTKTYSLDKDLVTNVSPRIIRGTVSNEHFGPHQSSFLNIELISEKTAAYWCKSIHELKRDFPTKVVIASIMCSFNKEDWTELASVSAKTGADALELNLSCPHGMGEKGMGLACGQNVSMVKSICQWVRAAVGPTFPFFAKLTPNVTEIAEIALAAKEGGATGVTAINTVSGLMGVNVKAEPWPGVGANKAQWRTTYGGMSGNATRPIALRAISNIARKVPGFPVLGTGGVDSAKTAIEQMMCGASVVQICSAIQNQDFSVIEDYTDGMRAYLYMQAREDLSKWDAQVPPEESGMPQAKPWDDGMPAFGPYWEAQKRRRVEYMREQRKKAPKPGTKLEQPERVVPEDPAEVPSMGSQIGKAVPRIGQYYDLDPKAQVVALIDSSKCIECGRCYMACNDTGYRAITFDKKTHLPHVTDDCTGCGLCQDACPIVSCIDFVPKKIEHKLSRGIDAGKLKEVEKYLDAHPLKA